MGGRPKLFQGKKWKCMFLKNGQFNGHLIFDKKTFFSEKKNFFTPKNTRTLVFWKKKHFPFFETKCFFGNVFSKKLKKEFDKFFIFRKVLEKTFPKKTFVFKKRKMFFFRKNKVLIYSSEKTFFSSKMKCLLNCQKRTLSILLLNKHWSANSHVIYLHHVLLFFPSAFKILFMEFINKRLKLFCNKIIKTAQIQPIYK